MNNNNNNLLIELGVAELPTAAVESLSQAFLDGMKAELAANYVTFETGKRFATARRLAVLFTGVSKKQGDQQIEKRGPAMKAAKDADGNWTKAASGFAASCGVLPEDLVAEETAKGEWLFYRGIELGQATTTLIPKLFKSVMDNLPIAKRMRWGAREDSFMRPVITLTMLWNDEIIDAELFGIQSGRKTIGHRFHGDKTLDISSALTYEDTLANSYVIADIDKRRAAIIDQVQTLVATLGNAKPILDDELIAEVNALVEYPVAILGEFDPRYQHIPQEVLIKTMKDNQKYFAIVDDSETNRGTILPNFITIANIESTNPEVVRVGNQRVIEPRFADAEFFWENDKKKTLASRCESLKKVVYQEKLGSIYDRSERIAKIANFIADLAGLDDKNAIRAAKLAKCDLVSEMVFEFGELQGVIGQYYAENDGENTEIAAAIREQYLPKFAGDNLPETDTGLVVSLADKIENIVGGFAVGAKPTGTKDPYALRRASLGVIRLLNETKLDLSLEVLLDYAVEAFNSVGSVDAVKQVNDIKTYIHERLKGYYHDKGCRHDVFESVLAVLPKKISDFSARIDAVSDFVTHESASNLFAANKRISNILKKSGELTAQLNSGVLKETQEKSVYDTALNVKTTVETAVQDGDYAQALTALATLRQPLDDFFDDVMVMVDDDAVKNNRLALLCEIRGLFMLVADFSVIDASA